MMKQPDRKTMEFTCFYDNYDNEKDRWMWCWDKVAGEFYH
jgi:hypothetical protein